MKTLKDSLKKKNAKLFFLALFVAAAFLAICSKSSPLYPINDWGDINCFFTVGKSMIRGLVPYRDLYEQKGPLLYFLFGLASLVSSKAFIGAYLLEVVSFSGFLYFSLKCVDLYVDDICLSCLSLPILAFAVTTSQAFAHGGSAEELCLVLLAYTLYTVLNALKDNRLPAPLELALNGACAMCVFLIKFSMLGFYLGYVMFIGIWLISKKEIQLLFRLALSFLAGAFVVFLPYLAYALITGSLYSFYEVYIYNNIFLYAVQSSIVEKASYIVTLTISSFKSNPVFGYFVLAGLVWQIFIFKRETLFTIITFLGLITSIFFGGVAFIYYPLILSVFSLFGVAALLLALKHLIKKTPKRAVRIAVSSVLLVGLLALSYFVSDNTYLMKYKKEDMPQYKFAEIINTVENPTLLNYWTLDLGFYTSCDIVPNCKFFCGLNIPLPEMYETQDKYIIEGKCDFIVTPKPLEALGFENIQYRLVSTATMPYEGQTVNYYLYQRTR